MAVALMNRLIDRFCRPLISLSLVLLVVAAALASWGACTAKRDRARDANLRNLFAKIAINRGITIVEQPLLTLRGHTRPVSQVAFSPNGRLVASAGGDGDATVRIWDSQTAELLMTLGGHDRG